MNMFTERPALQTAAIVTLAEGVVALGILGAIFAVVLGIWP